MEAFGKRTMADGSVMDQSWCTRCRSGRGFGDPIMLCQGDDLSVAWSVGSYARSLCAKHGVLRPKHRSPNLRNSCWHAGIDRSALSVFAQDVYRTSSHFDRGREPPYGFHLNAASVESPPDPSPIPPGRRRRRCRPRHAARSRSSGIPVPRSCCRSSTLGHANLFRPPATRFRPLTPCRARIPDQSQASASSMRMGAIVPPDPVSRASRATTPSSPTSCLRNRVLIQANGDLPLHAPGVGVRRRIGDFVTVTHCESPRVACVQDGSPHGRT